MLSPKFKDSSYGSSLHKFARVTNCNEPPEDQKSFHSQDCTERPS